MDKEFYNIYEWDMKIENIDKAYKEYFTENKIYEVRNGRIKIDKEYENSNKRFSLQEFFSKWGGDWIVIRVKINNRWYKLEE